MTESKSTKSMDYMLNTYWDIPTLEQAEQLLKEWEEIYPKCFLFDIFKNHVTYWEMKLKNEMDLV